ncbi:ABC transporter permease [Actinomadura madurae]|uniref:ABC transporter permease n=1 Tax=Actinomadura madurae TaxID=1993 RepID=UPI0020D1F702|nr:ABC transporter permease [Actinomadura madurae]MCP9985170.1 ABC transporter permease [Actinomadura madurae]
MLLPRGLVAAHSSAPLDDHVLVRGDADLTAVTAAYAGVRVVSPAAFRTGLSQEIRLQGFVGRVIVAAITGFILIGLVTTLAVATAARRREFALLRLVGATRRQVLRMLRLEAAIVLGTGIAAGTLIAAVTLLTFAAAVTGLPLPSVPPLTCAAVLLGTAGPAAAAILLPARAVLRRRTSPPSPERRRHHDQLHPLDPVRDPHRRQRHLQRGPRRRLAADRRQRRDRRRRRRGADRLPAPGAARALIPPRPGRPGRTNRTARPPGGPAAVTIATGMLCTGTA